MYRYIYDVVSDTYISACTDIHMYKCILDTYMTVCQIEM